MLTSAQHGAHGDAISCVVATASRRAVAARATRPATQTTEERRLNWLVTNSHNWGNLLRY